jgi:zinc and cadmium transporter
MEFLNNSLFQIVISTFIVSLFAFSGSILFLFKEKKIQKIIILLVAFSAGTLLGGAFFHMIPEGLEYFLENDLNMFNFSLLILSGTLLFYIIEKFLHWHHHHDINCKKHIIGPISLIGGGIHKLIDGLLIGGSFLVNTHLGITVSLLIIIHKIPLEIGNLALLLHSNYKKKKALILNYFSSFLTVIGGIFAYLLINSETLIHSLLPITAGGFIYIALADLIPELHLNKKNLILLNISLILGIIISYLFIFIELH